MLIRLLIAVLLWPSLSWGAFPQVQATSNNVTASSTSHVLTLPSGVVASNLLIAVTSETLGTTITKDAAWTELSNTAQGGTMRLVVAYKVAGASESNPTWTTGVSTPLHYVIYRIDSWHGTTAPAVGTAVGAVTSTPDPPSVTTSWGAEDNLFIAVGANNSAGTVSAIPTNYTNQVSQTTGAIIATARRELAASTDDPDTFTHSVSDDTVAQTIVVRGPTITGCRLLQNGTDKRLMQDGTLGRIFQGGGSCGGAPPPSVVPVRMLLGVGL